MPPIISLPLAEYLVLRRNPGPKGGGGVRCIPVCVATRQRAHADGAVAALGTTPPCSPQRSLSQDALGWVDLARMKQLSVQRCNLVGYSTAWWGIG